MNSSFSTAPHWGRILVGLALLASCQRAVQPASVHLQFGKPGPATASPAEMANYLLEKPQFVVSYNRANAHANWVAWHLTAQDLGGAERQDNFRPDPALPPNWPAARPADYTGTGFDRGHLCPSADRTATDFDNSATFLMSNIVPQSPNLNRNTWEGLESYCRELVKAGNELYIYAGTHGKGGSGSEGRASRLNDKINVPAACWKIVLVLPAGNDDMRRVDASTQVIAVWMPNFQSVKNDWRGYTVTVDEIEQKTGYDFFAGLPASVQSPLESSLYR